MENTNGKVDKVPDLEQSHILQATREALIEALQSDEIPEESKVPFFLIENKGKIGKEIQYGKNVKAKVSVPVIIEHPENPNLFCVARRGEETDFGTTLVGGGMKTNEQKPSETAKREVQEETGFYDFEKVEELPMEVHSLTRVPHKQENRYLIQRPVRIKLKSLERKGRKKEKHDSFKLKRMRKDNVTEEMCPPNVWHIVQKYLGKETKSDYIVNRSNQFTDNIIDNFQEA